MYIAYSLHFLLDFPGTENQRFLRVCSPGKESVKHVYGSTEKWNRIGSSHEWSELWMADKKKVNNIYQFYDQIWSFLYYMGTSLEKEWVTRPHTTTTKGKKQENGRQMPSLRLCYFITVLLQRGFYSHTFRKSFWMNNIIAHSVHIMSCPFYRVIHCVLHSRFIRADKLTDKGGGHIRVKYNKNK